MLVFFGIGLACGGGTRSVAVGSSVVSPILVSSRVEVQDCFITLSVQDNNGLLVTFVHGGVTELGVEVPKKIDLNAEEVSNLFFEPILPPFARKVSTELRLVSWVGSNNLLGQGVVVLNGVANGEPRTFSGEFSCQN